MRLVAFVYIIKFCVLFCTTDNCNVLRILSLLWQEIIFNIRHICKSIYNVKFLMEINSHCRSFNLTHNIKIVLTGTGHGDVDWAHLVLGTDHSRVLINSIIKRKAENCLNGWANIKISGNNIPHRWWLLT